MKRRGYAKKKEANCRGQESLSSPGPSIIYIAAIGNGMTNSFDDIQNNKMTITQIMVSLSVDIYVRETKQRSGKVSRKKSRDVET